MLFEEIFGGRGEVGREGRKEEKKKKEMKVIS